METVTLFSALTVSGLTISGDYKLIKTDIEFEGSTYWLVSDDEAVYMINAKEAKSAIN